MRQVLTHTLVILVIVTSLGAAHRPESSKRSTRVSQSTHPSAPGVRKERPYQIGRASWYGKFFHGRKTASGERYDMFQFTAAHPALPLGTNLKVTNLKNGRWVIVRVNDRGPVPKSRIIDLSYGAAQILGLRVDGIERVRLDVIHPDTVAVSENQVASLR